MALFGSIQDLEARIAGITADQVDAGLEMPGPQEPIDDDLASLFGDEVNQEGNDAAGHGAALSPVLRLPGAGTPALAIQGTAEQVAEPAPEPAPERTPEDTPPHEPTNETPVKRGRGRPKGSKGPVRPEVKLRCRYGCEHKPMLGVDLRKHMGRIHGLFSSEIENVRTCACGRRYNPDNKSLRCTKRAENPDLDICTLSDKQRAEMNVIAPRDSQEAVDTFGYVLAEDSCKPSESVIVHDGDDEKERRAENAAKIANWVPQAAPVAAPAAPLQGKGKKRTAEEPAPAPAPKRAEVEGEAVQQPFPNGLQAVQAAPLAPQVRQAMPEAQVAAPALQHQAPANAAIGGFGLNNNVGNFNAGMQMAPQVMAPQANAPAPNFVGMGFQQPAPGIAPPLPQQQAPANAAIGGFGNNVNFFGDVNFNFGVQMAPQANAHLGGFGGMGFQPLAPEIQQQNFGYFPQQNAQVPNAAFDGLFDMGQAGVGERGEWNGDFDFFGF